MLINEIVKSFLKPAKQDDESSAVKQDKVLLDMSTDDNQSMSGFFDSSTTLFGSSDASDIIFKQKDKITKYRQLAMTTDVTDALEDIVNEIIFTYDDELPISVEINEENDKLVEAVTESFNKIVKLTDLKRSLFQIVKRSYVDGQLVFHCAYSKKNTKGGMTSIRMIDPCLLYFDKKDETYKYMAEDKYNVTSSTPDTNSYSIEEIVREDFGLYDGKVNLGYLEHAIKPANMLNTLEDLLIPLRFSRSISRRVFNVDIAELPNKRGKEVMEEHQRKFKYKKFYNNKTGEVSNQQHITSMVEDYWFANRNGGRGTTVDVLDETGNLGEMNDILYFARKLYKSLKIPNSRISLDSDSDHDFDYESTRVSKDDMKFFMFISRVRQVYSSAFKEILKREVVATGVMTVDEWDDKEELIAIKFANDNTFIEKMKLDTFMSKLDIYSSAKEHAGSLLSYEKIMKDVFKFTDEEIEQNLKDIQKERTNPLFSEFYKEEDF